MDCKCAITLTWWVPWLVANKSYLIGLFVCVCVWFVVTIHCLCDEKEYSARSSLSLSLLPVLNTFSLSPLSLSLSYRSWTHTHSLSLSQLGILLFNDRSCHVKLKICRLDIYYLNDQLRSLCFINKLLNWTLHAVYFICNNTPGIIYFSLTTMPPKWDVTMRLIVGVPPPVVSFERLHIIRTASYSRREGTLPNIAYLFIHIL